MQKELVHIRMLSVIISMLFIFIFSSKPCLSQNKKEKGLIIFRPELYFIKSKEGNLSKLFKNKIDTLNALSLGVPGDDAGNSQSFQNHLMKTIRLDTATYLTNLANNYDLYIEGWQKFYWTYGYINYLEDESRKVTMNYAYITIINGEKRIVLKIVNDTHLQSFTSVNAIKKKVCVVKK